MDNLNQITSSFVICVRNEQYQAALEKRKIYQLLPDTEAVKYGQLRVIDESGEDYLYPKEYFIPIDLPEDAQLLFNAA